MPEAQDQPGLGAFQARELDGELGRIGMAVACVNEAAGLSVIESIDVIEIGGTINHAQLERRDQRGAGSTRPGSAPRAQAVESRGTESVVDMSGSLRPEG